MTMKKISVFALVILLAMAFTWYVYADSTAKASLLNAKDVKGEKISQADANKSGNLKQILIIKNYNFEANSNKKLNEKIKDILKEVPNNLIIESTRGFEGKEVYRKTASSVVIVVTDAGTGSGVIVGKKGYIVTNWHVVENCSDAVVVFKPEKGVQVRKDLAYSAKVLKVNEKKDLALLEVKGIPSALLKPIHLGDFKSVEVGEDAYAIGHPQGQIWTYTQGVISQIRPGYTWKYENEAEHIADVIQTQTPINPGNSGGALLNPKGELIGINTFSAKGEGLNYAVSVKDVNNFLSYRSSDDQTPQEVKQKQSAVNTNEEYAKFDLDKDNYYETVGHSKNKNGRYEIYYVYADKNDKVTEIWIDENYNYVPEIIIIDSNRDGIFEIYLFDSDEDGVVDLKGYDFDGDKKIDRYEKP